MNVPNQLSACIVGVEGCDKEDWMALGDRSNKVYDEMEVSTRGGLQQRDRRLYLLYLIKIR